MLVIYIICCRWFSVYVTPSALGVRIQKLNKCRWQPSARRSLLCPNAGLPRLSSQTQTRFFSPHSLIRSTVRAENSLEGKAALAKRDTAALR